MAGIYTSLVMHGLAGVDPSAKLVALALAECAQVKDHGIAFPSVDKIAGMTGICGRQVRDHLRELQHRGWIEPVGTTHGGRGMATRYRLNLIKMRASIAISDAKRGAVPPGYSPNKPGTVPPSLTHENPAAHRMVLPTETRNCSALNPAESSTKPGGAVPPNRFEKDIKRVSRARTDGNPVTSMHELLKPIREMLGSKSEKENVDDREDSVPRVNPSPQPDPQPDPQQHRRSQSEQVEWVRQQLAAKGKP